MHFLLQGMDRQALVPTGAWQATMIMMGFGIIRALSVNRVGLGREGWFLDGYSVVVDLLFLSCCASFSLSAFLFFSILLPFTASNDEGGKKYRMHENTCIPPFSSSAARTSLEYSV